MKNLILLFILILIPCRLLSQGEHGTVPVPGSSPGEVLQLDTTALHAQKLKDINDSLGILLRMYYWQVKTGELRMSSSARFGNLAFSTCNGWNSAFPPDSMGWSYNDDDGNTFFGIDAGTQNSTGSYNTGYGFKTLSNLQTYIGMEDSIALGNTAVGWRALENTSHAQDNTAIGAESQRFARYSRYQAEGNLNVSVGARTLRRVASKPGLTWVTDRHLYVIPVSAQNTAVGNDALASTVLGFGNTAVGCWALFRGDSVYMNTALGWGALQMLRKGSLNQSMGIGALEMLTNGDGNIAIGYNAGGNVGLSGRNVKYNMYFGYLAGARAGQWSNRQVMLGPFAGLNDCSNDRLYIANDSIHSLIYGQFDKGRLAINTQRVAWVDSGLIKMYPDSAFTVFRKGSVGGLDIRNGGGLRLEGNITATHSMCDTTMMLGGDSVRVNVGGVLPQHKVFVSYQGQAKFAHGGATALNVQVYAANVLTIYGMRNKRVNYFIIR